ncbi:MAG: hypothetical protein ACLR0U_28845 [Enterocloster clostridioformis]
MKRNERREDDEKKTWNTWLQRALVAVMSFFCHPGMPKRTVHSSAGNRYQAEEAEQGRY